MTYTTINYDRVIGRDTEGNYIVLNYIFSDDGRTGAVGEIVAPISKDYYDESMSYDGLEEFYEDAWREDAGSRHGTELGLSDWVQCNEDVLSAGVFDRSLLVEEYANFNAYATDIIGCGRIFPIKLAETYEPALVGVIENMEK